MKRFVISMYVCCCAVFCSCSDDDKLPDVRPAAKGEYTDVRDGNTYVMATVTNGFESVIWNG